MGPACFCLHADLRRAYTQENVPEAHRTALAAAEAAAAKAAAELAARDAELAARGSALRQLATECAAAQEQARPTLGWQASGLLWGSRRARRVDEIAPDTLTKECGLTSFV